MHEPKVVKGQTFKQEVTEKAVEIEGYTNVGPSSSTITIELEGNEIVFYYTKRTDLSYTVKYLEKDTDIEIDKKVVNGKTFKEIVTEKTIDIDGYNKVEPIEKTITIGTGKNEIIFYYIKRTDLSYTVKYLEKDSDEDDSNNVVLHEPKVVKGQTFKQEVTEKAEDIDGYDKIEPKEKTITIGATGNEIVFYYTKRTDLSYTVKYLEKDSDEDDSNNVVLHEAKVVNGQTFKQEVTEKAEDIDGYNKVEPKEKTITIGITGNEIIFYYTKRTDLSYTVKYLEKDTDIEIDKKVVNGKTFKEIVTEKTIDIDGYNKVEPIEKTITIGTGKNEIIFYYIKRTDLSYTVKYLEKDSDEDDSNNVVLHEAKVVNGQIFKQEVTEKAIDIDGYNKVAPKEKTIIIGVTGNEIVFYYTKKKDLSYTVKYLEKDSDEDDSNNVILHEPKVVNGKTFKETVTEKAEDIDGYNKVEPIEKTITIGTGKNEIIFYYTKRTDLSYTVNYLEKDTNTVLKDSKVVNNQTFGTVIETIEEKIAISGYDFNSIDKEKLIITTNPDDNVINIFYTKSKFNYIVEYYYDNEIDNSKTSIIEATFQDIITTYEDKNIKGYKLEKVEGLPLTVTEYPAINVIKVYYIKDVFNYTVKYYYDEKLASEKTETLEGVFGTIINTYKDKVEYGYELDRVENLPLTITKNPEDNVISVFYKRKDAQVIVKYVDKATSEEIAEKVIKTGKVFDEFDVSEDEKEIEGYTLIEIPDPTTGVFKEEPQEKIFYYAKNTRVVVKYLEKETDIPVADEVIIEGYEGKDYTTIEQKVDNYTCVDNTGNLSGKMARDEITVIYYYLQNTKVIVNHIDKISDEVLMTEEHEGLVGDKYSSKAKGFDGYVLVEKPKEETVIMTKEVIILNYYYKKVSAGVIEKHIDIKTGDLLDSTFYEGNEGDKYKTEEKEFHGYDLVVDQMPENAEGEMTVEVIEVKYYYIRKTSVKVEYIDKATGKTINEIYQSEEKDSTEYIIGHEGESYKTVEKEFTGYDIVTELYPTNSEGTMQVSKDESGNDITEIIVRYYYVYKTELKERHLDVKTGEVLQEVTYTGHEGDEYTTSSKEISGYDLVKEKFPTNAKGKMTVDTIIVDYYYIKNMTVRVEYIDINSNEKLVEKVQESETPETYIEKDSTEIIKGHEGDEYITKEKSFENYTIVKDKYPQNCKGNMEVIKNKDGTISTEIVVRYYYVHVSSGVIEKHIDAITGKELASETRYQGYEGDPYKTSSKEFKGYDLAKNRLPENAEGKMAKEVIIVKYYYIRKVIVTVQYLEEGTNNKLEADKIIESHEGEKYYAEKKNISGYEFVRIYGEDGTLEKDVIVIKYYYKKAENVKPTTSVNEIKNPTVVIKEKKSNTSIKEKIKPPETGDMEPVIAGGLIILVSVANVIISIVNKKRNNN